MEIPDLVRQSLGDEEVQAGVSLGDEDAVCLTPTRTLVYSGEGLLSDESIEEFSHDVERITLSEGRRKSTFELTYVGGVESFSVPADRTDKVLELLLEGVLRLDGVIEGTESLVGVYRFSELTYIIAEQRVLKHVGGAVWDEDFEAYPFSEVTRLEFEEASVATSVAISVDGRPQRVKVPNDQAPIVRQDLENALFGYYDVGSLDQLNLVLAEDETDQSATDDPDGPDELEFGSGIDPLVTGEPDEEPSPDSQRSDESTNATARSGPDGGAGGDERAGGAADTSADADESEAVSEAQGQAATDRSDTTEQSDERRPDTADQRSSASSTDDRRETPTTDGQSETSTNHTRESADRTTNREKSASDERKAEQSRPDAATRNERAEQSRKESVRTRTETTSEPTAESATASGATGSAAEAGDATVATREDLATVSTQVEELTESVEKQNELLERQHRAIKQLLSELRE